MNSENRQIYQAQEVEKDCELQVQKDKKLANKYLIFSFSSLGLSVLSYILTFFCGLPIKLYDELYIKGLPYNGPNSTTIVILHVITIAVYLVQIILNTIVFKAFYAKKGKIYAKMHVAVIVTVISCLSAIYSIFIYILTLY